MKTNQLLSKLSHGDRIVAAVKTHGVVDVGEGPSFVAFTSHGRIYSLRRVQGVVEFEEMEVIERTEK